MPRQVPITVAVDLVGSFLELKRLMRRRCPIQAGATRRLHLHEKPAAGPRGFVFGVEASDRDTVMVLAVLIKYKAKVRNVTARPKKSVLRPKA